MELHDCIFENKVMVVVTDQTSPEVIKNLYDGGVRIFERKFKQTQYEGFIEEMIFKMARNLGDGNVLLGAIGLRRPEQYREVRKVVDFQTPGPNASSNGIGSSIDYLLDPRDVYSDNGVKPHKLFIPTGISCVAYLHQLAFLGDHKLIPMLRDSDDLRCIEAIFRAGAFAVEVGAECLSQYARNNDGVEGIFQEIETGRQRRQKDLEEAD